MNVYTLMTKCAFLEIANMTRVDPPSFFAGPGAGNRGIIDFNNFHHSKPEGDSPGSGLSGVHTSNLSHGTLGAYDQPAMQPPSTYSYPSQRYLPPSRSAGGHILEDEFAEDEEPYNPYHDNVSPTSSGAGMAGFAAGAGAGGASHYYSEPDGHRPFDSYQAPPSSYPVQRKKSVPSRKGTGGSSSSRLSSRSPTSPVLPPGAAPASSYLSHDPFASRLDNRYTDGEELRRSTSSKSGAITVPSMFQEETPEKDLYDSYYGGMVADDKSEVTGASSIRSDQRPGGAASTSNSHGPDPRLDADSIALVKARRAAFASGPVDSHMSAASLDDHRDYSRKIFRVSCPF